jgi:hypothetical protein
MYKKQLEKINEDIDRTQKAIIGLGCSFVQGQGAFNKEIVKEYGTHFTELGNPLQLNKISKQEKKLLLKTYPSLAIKNNEIDFTFMEYDNAFPNVLAEKYFNKEYASINLGQRGCGNRATINELYLHPEINWDKLKEIIVIYCPSGLERFDFINDQFNDHNHWICMWPHSKEGKPRSDLWSGYKEAVYSEKFEVLEQITYAQQLLAWCKLHNAKLIITPAFDIRYSKEHFRNALLTNINRDINGNLLKIEKDSLIKSIIKETFNVDEQVTNLLNLFPWENMFYPDNMPTFVDMTLKQEFNHTNSLKYHFWSFIGKGTPDNWLTPCAHPSAKAHDYFAKLLYEHLTK